MTKEEVDVPVHYELSAGAVAILDDILPAPQWYKDEAKQAALMVRAMGAADGLPTVERPKPEKDEDREVFAERFEAWAATNCEFEWLNKFKDTAKICVAHYLKQASLPVSVHAVALVTMFGLADKDTQEPTQYKLPTGAIAVLEEIIPTQHWYKEEPKQANAVARGHEAVTLLPDTAARPKPETDETKEDFEARADTWAAVALDFKWTDAQKAAAKACLKYYIKQGALAINPNSVALITLFGLADE